MAKPSVYELTVANVVQRTPNLRRIVLEGDLSGFPSGYEGGYVKLLLPRAGAEGSPVDLKSSVKRSYTVRAFDRAKGQLTLEFAVHEAKGPAMRWARDAAPGDALQVAGPGSVRNLDLTADDVLLVGDMTALPAISVQVERLPASARGHAVIEILCEEDRQALGGPEGLEVHWVVRGGPPADCQLAEVTRALPWPSGSVSAWVACEFATMKLLRTYLLKERRLDKEHSYISSYWKSGSSDEQHKAAKLADKALGLITS